MPARRSANASGAKALAQARLRLLGVPLQVQGVEALILGMRTRAARVVDLAPPEDDVRRIAGSLQEHRPAALRAAALRNGPAVPHGGCANRLRPAGRRALRQLQDDTRTRWGAR